MPIRSRCPAAAVVLAVVAAALLAPLAQAQGGLGSVELTASPPTATAAPGGKALFRVEARNDHLLERNVAFVAQPPAGWTFNFTPVNLTLAPGARGNVTLEVFAPADAAVNATVAVPFDARAHGTDLVLARSLVNVTVPAPPPPPTPGTSPPPAPALEVRVGPSSGAPGRTVEGVVTLVSRESSTLEIRLGGEGPAGWNPRFLAGDDVQILHPGEAPRTVRVYASIPSTAAPDTAQVLTVVATANGVRMPAAWSVTVTPPSQDGTQAPSEGSSTPAPSGGGSSGQEIPTIEPEPRTALDARVVEGLLQVAPGGSAAGTLRLENVGTTPLKLRLTGRGPTDWADPVPERAYLDLAPGGVEEVAFTLRAPPDVIPSSTGRGAGFVTVTSDNGLMRTAGFQVMVVPGGPRELAAPTSETNAAQVDPGASSGLPFGAVGLAAVGAVGAGAVALANRPLREKLVWAAVGLYTRLARPDVLGHEDRERLYKLIESTPGVHFHALQRDLAWNTGTLTYHLRVLEKHGFVVSRRDGLYRRFYLQGSAPRKEVFENAGPSGLRADVLEAVRNQPAMSQTDLALALGANKQTVNYHVKALERQGHIRLEKRGRETFLYPSTPGVQGEAKP